MSGTQQLRLLLNERLAAVAEEICWLVERTITEYEDKAVRSEKETQSLKRQLDQLTALNPQVALFTADTQPPSEELLPSLQQCDISEQAPVMEETELQEHPQVKEEQEDQWISGDMEPDESSDADFRYPLFELAPESELFASSSAVTFGLYEYMDDRWSEGDGPSSPLQSHSVKDVVELEEPPREEKYCRFCGISFEKDIFLIRHVETSHKGHKAFKCLHCNKEFEKRSLLIVHSRIHTGEKPFICDFCGKAFAQKASRNVHMKRHTRDKTYMCKKCGERVPSSYHLKLRTMTPKKGKGKGKGKSSPCTACCRTPVRKCKGRRRRK